MRPNLAFQRAINGLTHPLSITAIVILLFNDHWLRWHYPSWLTGKLGDFVWLIFAPLIAALLFSWLIPRRLKQHESIVGIASFAFIGLWFVLGKTEPTVHRLTVSLLETLMNWRDTLRMDASDLLMLPGLLVGYGIWRHASAAPLRTRPGAYVACALGIMATLANSPARVPYDTGLHCIIEKDGQLMAFTFGEPSIGFYLSRDGGLTWSTTQASDQQSPPQFNWTEECPSRYDNFTISDPNNPNFQYRFHPAQAIDRSSDGGKSWTLDLDLSDLAKDVRVYYQSQKEAEVDAVVIADPGPFDAIIDTNTGNLVVAMGFEGILVHTPDGQWNWIDVGPYQRVNIYRFDRIFDLLKGELILAGILIVLVIASHLQPHKPLLPAIMLWGSWALWAIGVWTSEPQWRNEPFTIINLRFFTYWTNALAAVIALLLVVGAIANILDQKISTKQVRETLLLAVGSAIFFLFPYLLWSQGTIPNYSTASIFGLLLGLSAAFGTGQYLKRRYPATIPEKVPEKQ